MPMSPGAACCSRWWGSETVMARARVVRLVATDLDGTLLRGDGLCSGRTRTALAAAARAGIQVVLVAPPGGEGRWRPADGRCRGRPRAALAAAEGAGIQVVRVTARPPRWLQ